MFYVSFKNKKYPIAAGQSVLDALLEQQEELNFFCKSGLCQSCIMEFCEGSPPSASQAGLSEAEKTLKKFLPCVCYPNEDITIKKTDTSIQKYSAIIKDKKVINNEFIILKLHKPKDYQFYPGQYLNIYKSEKLLRSYSIASLCDHTNEIELHIKHYLNGSISNWIFSEKSIGDTIELSSALGSCFYTADAQNKPLLLLGVSTGVAPLLGICRQAIFAKHTQPIIFIQGGATEKDLYAHEYLQELTQRHNQFNLYSCCLSNEYNSNILDFVDKNYANLENWKVYICGSPAFVKAAQELVFLMGAHSNDIHCDSFIFQNK